ncbi:MAG: glycosyltransferase [Candidatus Binatia bacterium]
MSALAVHLDADLTEPFPIGAGNVLVVTGRCHHPTRALRRLTLVVDGAAFPIVNHSCLRPEMPAQGPDANARTSGFWVTVPFAAIAEPRRVTLALRAELDDGSVADVDAGALELVPARPAIPAARDADALVAICLATCDPDPAFFAAQIDSLLTQTHQRWVCIVSDDGSAAERFAAIVAATARDPRFTVVRNDVRLGHYRNFERALGCVPAEAGFVALSDHDDIWYPEKLAVSLAAFGPETTLVYTDMDVVAVDGRVLSRTYWTTRRNNYTDLAALVFANTVTGASTVFRTALLAVVLPFPIRVGEAYHDHWIACAALTAGTIGYVDAPMYAYRQHADNVLGHFAPPGHRLLPKPGDVLRALGRAGLAQRTLTTLWRLREIYDRDVVRLVVIARVLLERLRDRTTPTKRRTLEHIARLERSRIGLAREAIAAAITRRPTLGAERYCLRGAFAAWVLDRYYRWRAATGVRR